MSFTRLKNIYKLMKYRCQCKKYDKYKYYGEKGINVCDEWNDSYSDFEKWALEHGYEEGLTLDRINVNADYNPNNCRWVTRKDQANNKTTNKYVTYDGKTKTLQQWADDFGISYSTIRYRLRSGWELDDVFNAPIKDTRKATYYTYNGKTKRLYQWAKELGINAETLNHRILYRKWSVEKAFETPVKKYEYHSEV